MDGGMKFTDCENFNECKKLYLTQQNAGVNNVPYMLFQGQNRVWARYASGGATEWNGYTAKYEQIWDLTGQYIMKVEPKKAT
jgi:hypothetical protein